MRKIWLVIGILISTIISLGLPALAEDTPPVVQESVTVKTTAAVGITRDYNVIFTLSGKVQIPDSKEATNLDTQLQMKLRHKYGIPTEDGSFPLEISVVEGRIKTGEEILTISPATYPKLTVILNKESRIEDIFGANSANSRNSPGIGYSNMIILFYLPDGDKPHKMGETWASKISLPTMGEAYNVINTLKSVEEIKGVKVACVHQDITRNGNSSTKVSVDSKYSISDGKLLKSLVECTTKDAPTVKLDISPAK